MKDRYGLFRIRKDRTGKADMQESGAKGPGKTDIRESGTKLSAKADVQETGEKRAKKTAAKSPKGSRNTRGPERLFRDRRLTAAGLMLCAGILCIVCTSVVKRISSRDDSVHVLPVTLAGALTENNADEYIPEEQNGDEKVRMHRKTKMLLNALVNDLQTAGQCSLKEPPDPEKESSLEAAAAIGYKSMQMITENQPMSYTDYFTLLQIVEAECTGGDERSKLLVANVILNRVEDEHFPDNVYDVVWHRLGGQAQFSPTQDGRMGTLSISDTTISAVKRAVEGEDISEGALFFLARKYSSKSSVDWFDSKLVYLFSHGGHDFYKFRDEAEETEAEA